MSHLRQEALLGCQRRLLALLGLALGQRVQIEAQCADLAAQLLAGLSPAARGSC
jgi:hypothetical protein